MAFQPSFKSRVLLGDFSLSAYVTKISTPFTASMLDVTTIADTAKSFIVGQNTSTLSIDGYIDPDATANALLDQMNTFTSQQPVTYAPRGLTLGNEVWLINALKTQLTHKGALANPLGFSLAAQTDGTTEMGVSLHDLTAETVDTDSTSYDQTVVSTAAGGVGHLHVTAFSGFSTAVITIADSANNSTFATIGTFTTVAGVTQERIVISGTVRRYVRVSIDVTGSGSITFSVGFARR